MKRYLGIVFLLMVLIVSVPALAENHEDQFWQAVGRGDYLAAAKLAADIGASDAEYNFLAGVCYQNSFRYQESNLYFQKFGRSGNPDKLGSLLTERIKKSAGDPQVLILAGISGILEPDLGFEDPTRYLEQARRKVKENAFIDNYLGFFKLNQNDDSVKTKKLFLTAIGLKKDFPEAYNNLAVAYAHSGDTEQAVGTLLDCLANCPSSPDNTFASLVNLTSKDGMITITPCDFGGKTETIEAPVMGDEYREKIKTALAQYPNQLLRLTEYFTQKANFIEAESLLQGLEVHDGTGLYDYVKFQIAKLKGAREEMEGLGNKILADNVLDYQRLFQCGVVLFDSGDPLTAEKFFEATLPKIHPADENYLLQCYSNMGTCYYANKEYDKAIMYLKKALEYYPEDTISLINLGLVYRDQGDKGKAGEYFQKALDSSQDEQEQATAEKYLEGLKE
ncbi:MAG TPA: hypothetical protein DDW50_01920 [Firmicutes bacterium]|jgi:tetratricopeptide (TPR) repeat protein|nr:hypothetical protein [Bacillota bacterium]